MEAPREKIVVRRKMKQQSPEGEQIVEVEEIHTYVSADGHHDNHMVQYCVNELLPFMEDMMPGQLEHVHFQSDNCSDQLKQREHFKFMTSFLETFEQALGEREMARKLTCSHEYSCESYGKDASDAAGSYSKGSLT